MERYKKLEIVVDTTLDAADKALLFDQLALGTAEMVHRGGEVILWADTPEAEDVVINSVIKKNKGLKVKRLPKRWAETTALEAEGTLSLDGTRKLVEIDSVDKAKVHTPLQKNKPTGYDVTVEYLESLNYTDLKNFIRRYPELDADLNLSQSQAVLLEATKNYFGLGEPYVV